MHLFQPIKVLVVIGTRPEAIKMAPVLRQLGEHAAQVSTVVCSTGQHRELLHRTLDLFGITPDCRLDVMLHDQTLAGLTARLFQQLDPVVRDQQPDWLLVQGDTTTALVGAMTGFYRRVRVAHVEAGLRTGDLSQPFPEELNRRVVDLCADLCFAPTERARANLLRDGVPPNRIHVTGNTIVDALLEITARPYDESAGPLASVAREPRWILVTMHRRESFGAPVERVLGAVQQIAKTFGDAVHVILPVHPNPHLATPLARMRALPNCSVVPPLDYPDLLHVLARAALVLTDSGGIQEEAPTFGVPVLVLRDKTERPEGIEAGAAQAVGTHPDAIVSAATRILREHRPRPALSNPYGDGQAAKRIVGILRQHSPDANDPAGHSRSGA
jgi:UDP-N-acetylglucosamine 2-epimerase (non-hydrolysing)